MKTVSVVSTTHHRTGTKCTMTDDMVRVTLDMSLSEWRELQRAIITLAREYTSKTTDEAVRYDEINTSFGRLKQYKLDI